MKKRIAGILAAAAVTVAMMPVVVSAANGTEEVGTWSELEQAVSNAGSTKTTIKLTSDIDASTSSDLTIQSGQDITLDLNGYALILSSTVYVKGDLELVDSDPTTVQYFTFDDTAQYINWEYQDSEDQNTFVTVDGGVITSDTPQSGIMILGGTFTMNGGSICGMGGPGIYQYSGAFTMNAGSICGNASLIGGGIYAYGGSVVINGGSVYFNSAEIGGGVCIDEDASLVMTGGDISANNGDNAGGLCLMNNAECKMSGGKIHGNYAGSGISAGLGGGVYLSSGSSFTMTGGKIDENCAFNYAGGIYADGASVVVGGSAYIRDNETISTDYGIYDSNIYLVNYSKTVLTVSQTDPLTSDADIGVTVNQDEAANWKHGVEVGSYLGSTMTDENCKYFTMTNCGASFKGHPFVVEKSGTNYVLAGYFEVGAYSDDYGSAVPDNESCKAGSTVTLTVKPESKYQLKEGSLTVKDSNGNTVTLTQDTTDKSKFTFTMPEGDVTVEAVFEREPHVHHIVLADEGKAATYAEAGYKKYYECTASDDACHMFFDDADGKTPIEDLDAWKKEGGNGYIDKLKYTVTFDSGKGRSGPDNQEVYLNGKVTKPSNSSNPTLAGYDFAGWELNGEEYDFDTPVTADITLVARYKEYPTIAISYNGDGFCEFTGLYGEKLKLTSRVRSDVYFSVICNPGNGVKSITAKSPGGFSITFLGGEDNVYNYKLHVRTDDVVVTVITESLEKYEMITGAEQQIYSNASSAVFASNAEFSKFNDVFVDGIALSKGSYSAESGSTIITLNSDIISSLAYGTHTLRIVSTDGYAETKFTIVRAPNNPPDNTPKTGDNRHIVLLASCATVSFVGLGIVLCCTRKKHE